MCLALFEGLGFSGDKTQMACVLNKLIVWQKKTINEH